MDPAEIEFLAESASSIGIVPNFSEGTLYLLEGDVGPFRAGQPLQVGHRRTVTGLCSLANVSFPRPKLDLIRKILLTQC